ncbi:MAG TPA: RNA polymerase sigma factor [Bacteroidetes bacterium]|nr:RNA polymerase sigma factor [Bacteroidota bacterium]
MPNLREDEIINGCLKNDRVAQKVLYDQYKTQMYTLAYRITNNFEDANDVLQEGFIRVFENLKSFKGKSKLGTWIHTIMARAALKKIKNRIYFDELTEVEQQELIDWDSISDVQYLEKAIASLPDGYRSIFTLFEIEGFKHREIAEMMDISVSTSKTQLHKAKRMLQDKLKENRK